MNRYWNVKVETKHSNKTNADRRLFHIKIIDSSDKNIDYLNEDLNASDELDLHESSPSSSSSSSNNLIQISRTNDDEEDNIDLLDDEDGAGDEEDEDDDDYSSSFKVRANKTNDFMSDQFVSQLRSTLSSVDSSLLDCMFNGRNKRVSLFIVGCNKSDYNGLLVINENLYLLKPNPSSNYPYRIELLPNRVKFLTGTDNDLLGEMIHHALPPSSSSSSRDKRQVSKLTTGRQEATNNRNESMITLNLNLNLDKNYFTTTLDDNYLKDILFQINLVNSYYANEHSLKLKLNRFNLIDYDSHPTLMNDRSLILNNDDDLKATYKSKTTISQLFLNLIKQNSLQQSFESNIDSSTDSINLFIVNKNRFLANDSPSNHYFKFNDTNIYEHLFMNKKLVNFEGLATRSTLNLCPKNQLPSSFKKLPYESIVLVKDSYQRDASSLFMLNKNVIEQANVIIDLIGFNLGNKHQNRLEDASFDHDLSSTSSSSSYQNDNLDCSKSLNDYNWYFQLKNNHLNSFRRLKSRSPDLLNYCINRRIFVNRNRFCTNSTIESNRMQIQNENLNIMNYRMKSTLLKQINEFKKRNLCGNGVVDLEFGEQCDCGGLSIDLFSANSTSSFSNKNILLYNFVKNCNLNCCDMKTCRFKSSDMQCSMGECCNNECKLKRKSTECRPARQSGGQSTCDFVEYCDGKTPTCPEDVFYHNGLECSSNQTSSVGEKGTCWNGNCVSKNSQCKTLWSKDSSSSDPICYKNFNTIGFENGNCDTELVQSQNGTKSQKAFKKCAVEDAECGILNCQYGSDQPIIKSENYFKSTTIQNGHKFECKQVIASNKINIYVNDGSSCSSSNNDEKKICVNRKCTNIGEILDNDAVSSLPKQTNKCISPDTLETHKAFQIRSNIKRSKYLSLCSDNGICDNKQTCHCFDGFTGKYCEMRTDFNLKDNSISSNYGSSLFDSNFKGFYKNISMLNIVGFFSVILLVIFLISLFVCRGKSKKTKKNEKNLLKSEHQIKTNFLNEERDYDYSNEASLIMNKNGGFKKKKKSIFSKSSKQSNENKNTNNNNNNLSHITNSSENDFNLSVTKLNKAIQQLNYKPTKSILKKHSEHMQIDGEIESDSENPNLKVLMPQAQASIYNTLPLKRPNNKSKSPNNINDSNISASSFKLEMQGNVFVVNGTNSLNRSAMRASCRSAKNKSIQEDQIIYDNNVNGKRMINSRRSLSSSSSSSLNECLSSPSSGSNRNSTESSESLSILSSISKNNNQKVKSNKSKSVKQSNNKFRPNESANYEEISNVKEIQLASPFKSKSRASDLNDSDNTKISNTSTFVINNKYNEVLNKKISAIKSDMKQDSSFNTSITPKPVHQNQHQLVADAKSAKILRLTKFHEISSNQDSANMKKNDYLKVQDYLNELNILSKQNNFCATKRDSGSALDTNDVNFDMTESYDAADIEIIENNFDAALETDLEIYPEVDEFGLNYKDNINKLQTASLLINKLNKSNNDSNLELSIKNNSPLNLMNKIKSPMKNLEMASPIKESNHDPSLLSTPKRPVSLLTQNAKASKEVTSPHKFLMNHHSLQPLQLNIGNHKFQQNFDELNEMNAANMNSQNNLHTNNSESSSGYSSVIVNKQMTSNTKCDQIITSGSMSSSSTATMTSNADGKYLKPKDAKQHHLNGNQATNSGTGSSSISSTSSSTSLSLMSSLSQSPHQPQQQTFLAKRDHKLVNNSSTPQNQNDSYSDKTPIPPTPIKLYSNSNNRYDQTPKVNQQDENLKQRISYMLATTTSTINYND